MRLYRQCSKCGRDLEHGSYYAHVVCSSECDRASRRTVKLEHTCVVCGRAWVPVRRDAVTCGASCRAKLSRQRRATGG
jgi:hypothetical protein